MIKTATGSKVQNVRQAQAQGLVKQRSLIQRWGKGTERQAGSGSGAGRVVRLVGTGSGQARVKNQEDEKTETGEKQELTQKRWLT
jgi:hypothetical protein